MADMDLTGWKLTFADEFNSFSRYTGQDGSGTWQTWFYFGDRSLPDNGELQYYMDPDFSGTAGSALGVNPFSIEHDTGDANDGALRITAKPTDPAVKSHIWDYNYTSGLITTEATFAQTYGYFEIRAKMPEGKGLWPAFWLLPTDKSWPPELDTMEFFGGPNSRGEGGTTKYHYGSIAENGGFGDWVDTGVDLTEGFHTYGINWQADKITYYFDGKEVGSGPTPDGMHKPMYLLANLAVGGNWAEHPDGDGSFPAHYDIDYIRAYSNDPNATAVGPTPEAAAAPPSTDQGAADQGSTDQQAAGEKAAESTGSTEAPAPQPEAGASAATATPDVERGYVAPGEDGVATGTDAAENFFATAAGQTLIGNGGDDLFDIGTHTDTKIVVPGEGSTGGTTTVSTWATSYTLPDGVDNLHLSGDYGHEAQGNALANTIVAGGGADRLTGGDGNDMFVFSSAANQGSVVTDFKPGEDVIDLKGLMQSAGYDGSDPVADHVLSVAAAGEDASAIMFDADGAGPDEAVKLVTLEHVLPAALHIDTDYIWH